MWGSLGKDKNRGTEASYPWPHWTVVTTSLAITGALLIGDRIFGEIKLWVLVHNIRHLRSGSRFQKNSCPNWGASQRPKIRSETSESLKPYTRQLTTFVQISKTRWRQFKLWPNYIGTQPGSVPLLPTDRVHDMHFTKSSSAPPNGYFESIFFYLQESF